MSELTKRFSEGAKRVITAALLAAKEMGHSYVGSEHMLLGILRETDSTPCRLLCERGVEYEDIKKRIIGLVGMGYKTTLTGDDMTPICRRIILRATFVAGAEGAVSVGVEHLLISLLREECVAVRLLRERGVDIDELEAELEELYCDSDYEAEPVVPEEIHVSPIKKRKATPLLDANAIDLTERARADKIDPVIGREQEEERIISILLRRSKNNPCLVGEAGVGKTAIVESLALRISKGKVPKELLDMRILSLELSMVVAGTKYRGEFEEKIKNIIEEVKSAGDVILFIDEVHTIVGAGGAEGAIDASNILKPALARGEIRLIGATTPTEFRGSIRRDRALERRFQPVNIPEPSREQCLEMLYGIKKKYEAYHGITISDSAVEAAVSLSTRYIHDRSLPDKAIDLIDEAAANLKLKGGRGKLVLTEEPVAFAAEIRTGIPLKKLTASEKEFLCDLQRDIKKRIVGQDRAVNALCEAVRRSRCGIREGGKPSGSFLFVGKAGTGKTECAKALAESLFHSRDAFIRLDMSEFTEPHSVSKIIGAPPGYLGFGEGGALTERVRRSPYCLVLFDEIEKAHPDVRALFLQLLDEGVLTDSEGQTVCFDNAIVIMTANPGRSPGIGFGDNEKGYDLLGNGMFAPEFLDRIDEVITFRDLGREELFAIARNSAQNFCARLKTLGVNAEVSAEFIDHVLDLSKGFGARSVTRNFTRFAEEAAAELFASDICRKGEIVTFCIENNRHVAKIKQNMY